MPNDGDDSKTSGAQWRWGELLFGGGVIVWALASGITAIWWAATVTADIAKLNAADTTFDRRLDTLDNNALGNRITAVEVRVGNSERVLETVDRKIDRLLLRGRDPG